MLPVKGFFTAAFLTANPGLAGLFTFVVSTSSAHSNLLLKRNGKKQLSFEKLIIEPSLNFFFAQQHVPYL